MTPERGPDGRGRARTYSWPRNVAEVASHTLADEDVDVVILQRPHEVRLCREWLGRVPGVDVPAVYVEHNTPGGGAATTRHPMAGQRRIPLVHVTHFNRLMWDDAGAECTVIEHGIVDPGYRYTGDLARAGVVINEPVRRGRAVGADLLPMLAEAIPVDLFGMGADQLHDPAVFAPNRLRGFPDLPQHELHQQLARRRIYVHTHRWTSLGLSLLEAMHLGMPVAVLGCTEAAGAVPPEAGIVTVRPEELVGAARAFLSDRRRARSAGLAAREAAVLRFGLKRFLAEWDELLHEVAHNRPRVLL